MTHSEKRTNWVKEGILSCLTGFLYGGSSVIAAHPLDTVKTQMQAQSHQMNKATGSIQASKAIFKHHGILGFYKGIVPPFFGTSVHTSVMFSVFEALNTKWQHDPILTTKIPLSGGLEKRTVLAGMISGIARALVENPFEYAKVKR